MKKIISIFLIIIIILTLFVGCDSNKTSFNCSRITAIGYTLPQSAVYQYEVENEESGEIETKAFLVELLTAEYNKNVQGDLYLDETCNEKAVITKKMPKTIYRKDGVITKLTYVKTIYTTIYVVGNSVDRKEPVYDTDKNELLGYRHDVYTGYGIPITWFEYI